MILLRRGVRLIPVLLGLLVSLLVGVIGWEYWLARRPWVQSLSPQWLDSVLLALVLLAAIALGVLVIVVASIHGS
jgi:hypothetical protein